jgi:multidrug resistance efflux pump
MRVTDAKGWLALVGGALVIVAAVAWGTLGSIRTKVTAAGILLSGGSITEIAAQNEGQIVEIEVKAGDEVKKDQRIARLSQAALGKQIESLKERINELTRTAGVDAPAAVIQNERKERLQRDLQRFEKQFADGATVLSPGEGRVVEVRTVAGAHVDAGTPIVALEPIGERAELEALFYFDSGQGKSLKPGMPIELVPSVVRRERYGALIGKVKSVENFPSTRLGMMGALRNEQLVESFIQAAGGAPIAVRVELTKDPSTPSGYRWSSGRGPDVLLTNGTRCVGAAITRSQRPIALVFPALDDGG